MKRTAVQEGQVWRGLHHAEHVVEGDLVEVFRAGSDGITFQRHDGGLFSAVDTGTFAKRRDVIGKAEFERQYELQWTLPARRVVELAKQMGAVLDEYGSVSPVARRMGIDTSYLFKLLKGERWGIGAGQISAIVKETGANREFFYSLSAPLRPNKRLGDEQAILNAIEALPSPRRARLARDVAERWA